MSRSLAASIARVRRAALAYPEAWKDAPWDEWVAKVGTKIFAWVSSSEGELWLTVKLPHTGVAAITLPFAEPTAYGLGKSGWVTAHFRPPVPEPLVLEWIEESYRAVAPKRLVKKLDAAAGVPRRAGRGPTT